MTDDIWARIDLLPPRHPSLSIEASYLRKASMARSGGLVPLLLLPLAMRRFFRWFRGELPLPVKLWLDILTLD